MTADAVVLLHPLGSDHSFWGPVLENWSPGGVVLAPDLPGHGAAAPSGTGAGIEAYTQAVLDEIGAGGFGRVDVLGVSLGGVVAQDLAGGHPDLVRRLVVVDAVPVYPQPLRENWRDRAAVARKDGLAPLVDAMEAMWFTDRFREAEPGTVAAVRELFLTMHPEGYARTCEALEVADTRARLPKVTAPTLVVCGDHDAPAFVEAAPWMAEQLPDARVHWLRRAKHAAVLEQPKEFADVLAEFLA